MPLGPSKAASVSAGLARPAGGNWSAASRDSHHDATTIAGYPLAAGPVNRSIRSARRMRYSLQLYCPLAMTAAA